MKIFLSVIPNIWTPSAYSKREVSSTNYRENSHITDIFKSLDKLDFDMSKSSRCDIFKNEIKLIKIAYSLIRVEEINNWDIDDDKKRLVKEEMFSIIEEKYGNLDDVDTALLQSQYGMNIVEKYSNYLQYKLDIKVK